MEITKNCANDPVEIQLLRASDLPAALKLVEREQWNQTERDWKRMLGLSPEGCFAARCAGNVAGTVTTISYGNRLAWIGMMLVAEEQRRRGIGKQLMEAAIEYLQRLPIATVKLDATPAGLPLYESLGFVSEGKLERWEGTGLAITAKTGAACGERLRPALSKLDDRAFYAPRTDVLNSLLQDCVAGPVIELDHSGRNLRGYAFDRRGSRASYIGPVVAEDQSVAVKLVEELLQRLAGRVFVDVRIGDADLVSWLVEHGFTKQRDLTRMTMGRPTNKISEMVFAITGPELG